MLQVKGVLDKEEVLFAKNKGYLYGTHVVVGLPECLAEASKEPHAVAIMQHTLAVAVDEVDACFLVSHPQTIPGVLQAVCHPCNPKSKPKKRILMHEVDAFSWCVSQSSVLVGWRQPVALSLNAQP